MRLWAAAVALALSPWASYAELPLSRPIARPRVLRQADAPAFRSELLSLHKALVSIESLSGHERDVGRFLIDYLAQRGYKTRAQAVDGDARACKGKERFNVLAWRGSDEPRAKVLVTSHIDVVAPHIPYEIGKGDISKKTMIKGRGVLDAKGSVASMIVALEQLLASDRVGDQDVMLLFVVGEESAGDGMKAFSASQERAAEPIRFRAAIFGEPTENKLACGHKGILSCKVRARGIAGHSGYPWLGKSANEVMMRAMIALIDTNLGSSERFGNTTVNVGRFDGGVAPNVIAEEANVGLAVRVALGPEAEGAQIVLRKIQSILNTIDDKAFSLVCASAYGSVECNCEVPGTGYGYGLESVTADSESGFETVVVNYGTDVPHLKGNHTRYLYGPGTILVAHGPRENLTVGDLEEAVGGYEKLILHALKP